MGLNKSALKIILQEDQIRPCSGKLLCFGKQDIFVKPTELSKIFMEFGKNVSNENFWPLSKKVVMREAGFPDDIAIFQQIGFNHVNSLDGSPYEYADIIYDLNLDNLKNEHENAYDFIFDGGTIEHVFHIPNVFKNIYRLLKDGGRILHISPSSNHIDHGFYMFSPTLFYDFYTANNWTIHRINVFRYTNDLYDGDWGLSEYLPGCLHRVSMGGLDDALYGVICIAEKTEKSSYNKIPIQGMYNHTLWRNSKLDKIANKCSSIMLDKINGKGLNLKISEYL